MPGYPIPPQQQHMLLVTAGGGCPAYAFPDGNSRSTLQPTRREQPRSPTIRIDLSHDPTPVIMSRQVFVTAAGMVADFSGDDCEDATSKGHRRSDSVTSSAVSVSVLPTSTAAAPTPLQVTSEYSTSSQSDISPQQRGHGHGNQANAPVASVGAGWEEVRREPGAADSSQPGSTRWTGRAHSKCLHAATFAKTERKGKVKV